MKQLTLRSFVIAFILSAGLGLTSCKNKSKTDTNQTTTTQDNEAKKDAPVTIAPDDVLTRNVADATKDYPGVDATVSNGEVTLTGTIERNRLPKLMQSIQALEPKKVTNNLTVKD